MKRAFPCLVALALALAAGGVTRGQDRRVPGAGGTQRRLALVIGNDLYRVKPLANAANDATAMAAALRRIGFDVGEPALDLDGATLERRVKAFVAKVNPGDVAFFFYAGHGVQIEGVNYLVPVDFDADDEIDAKRKAYPVDDLRDRLETSGAALKLIVLDACRDNPFRWARARSGAGGLAAMQPGRGTLLAMATAPGKTASDNPGGKNGLFTAQLLKVIEQPGLKVKEVFERAQALVDEASGRKQLPWVEGIVIGDFYLVPPGAATASVPPATVPAVAPPSAGGGLDISDIEKQAAARAQWGQYQSRMAADFAKAEGFEKQAAQPADLKAAVWERFAQSYAEDNPFSVEDERLRQEARSRMERWKSSPASSSPSAELPASADAKDLTRWAPTVYSSIVNQAIRGTRRLKALTRFFPSGAAPDPCAPSIRAGSIHDHYVELVAAFRSQAVAAVQREAHALACQVITQRHPTALTNRGVRQFTGEEIRAIERVAGGPSWKPEEPTAFLLDDPATFHDAKLRRMANGLPVSVMSDDGAEKAVRTLLDQADSDVLSYWYTAWNAAGRP